MVELAPFLRRKGVRLQTSLRADMGMTFFFMGHPLVGRYTPEKARAASAIGRAFDGNADIPRVPGGWPFPRNRRSRRSRTGHDAADKSEMSGATDPARQGPADLYGYVDRNGDGWREQPDAKPGAQAGLAERPALAHQQRVVEAQHGRGGPEDRIRSQHLA